MTPEEKWNAATIRDNFIFSKTMEMYPDLCKRLIEIILNIRVRRIEYAEREKVIENRIDSKGVRLDVYVEDDLNRSFDLEMQVADSDNISKRSAYLYIPGALRRGTKFDAWRRNDENIFEHERQN